MSLNIEFTSTLPNTAAMVAAPVFTPEASPAPEAKAKPEIDDEDLRIPFASSILLKDYAYWQRHAYFFRKDLCQVLEDALTSYAERHPIPADEPMPDSLQADIEDKRAKALVKRAALTRRNKKWKRPLRSE